MRTQKKKLIAALLFIALLLLFGYCLLIWVPRKKVRVDPSRPNYMDSMRPRTGK